MANFIARLITWGILFLSLGTLGSITAELAQKAGDVHHTGLVKIGKFNRALCVQKKKAQN